MTNWPEWITTQDHIGSQYPFYSTFKEQPYFSLNFEEVYKDTNIQEPVLEVQSVIELLMRGYILGDKTLIKGIERAPWLAEYNENSNDWNYFDLPPHGEKKMDIKDAALKLKNIIYKETLDFIGNSKKVGILLSGGMDSRILAGILKEIQKNNDFTGEVIVYNWGIDDSRDVIYSKKIAAKYNWLYKHFPLNSEILKNNFYLVQKLGVETNPYNLHAMDAISNDKDSQIVLAGSYGDTLGRAKYDGKPLEKASPIVLKNPNSLGILKAKLINDYYLKIKKESISYRGTITNNNRKEFEFREIEYQRNHSRRYLSAAMSLIAMKKPLYQMLTSPKAVEFLWSLDISLRTDKLYETLLPMLPGEIGQIPWAQNGQRFMSDVNHTVDYGKPSYHEYGLWLRNDLKNFINEQLDFNSLYQLGIFNEKSLNKVYKLWPEFNGVGVNKLDKTISWLTVFSMFIKKHNLKHKSEYNYNIKDSINNLVVTPKIQLYKTLKNNSKK